MCGIAGIISKQALTDRHVASLRAVNQRLIHRGPDGEGEYRGEQVMLAMRRLSIIDLGGGWQPLFNEDRSLVLICNGEIYNFIELRQQLEALGHRFSTGSDCETILHLYEEHGLDCVQHLRGMFAFALWDNQKRRLMLARDRMGEKPLYLYEKGGDLLFASEMKALLASGMVPFELDADAVNVYFHYQYVPEPATPIQGVRKLDAAHLLTVDLDPWRIEEHCYWRMEDAPPLEDDPATAIREQLEPISEIVVRSDVPVGVALSGGFDSSAIAALAASKYPGTMHAFSVGYPGRPAYDERADALALADHLNLPFHDVELTTDEIVTHFPELVYWQDDPIADIAGFGYYSVMKLAREHGVPVVLQGQGGDELFWGYSWVSDAARQSARKAAARGALKHLPQYLSLDLPRGFSRLDLGEWAHSLGGLRPGWQNLKRDRQTPAEQLVFMDLVPEFSYAGQELSALYAPTFLQQLNGANAARSFTLGRPWPNLDVTLTKLICETYLRENGIAQGDRLSMASSIELRLPLVDYRLVETVIGLRKFESDRDWPPKAWFKEGLRDVLPEWVMNRPKRGFNPPVREWQSALLAAYGNSLADGYLVQHKILTPHSARQLAADPSPPDNLAPISFKALVLEQWCRRMSEACPA